MYIAKRLSSNTVLCLQQYWDQRHPVYLTEYVLGQKIKVVIQLLAIAILLLKKDLGYTSPDNTFTCNSVRFSVLFLKIKQNKKTTHPPTHLPS